MKKSIYIFIITLLLVLIIEILLRFLGFSPIIASQKISWSPNIGYTSDSLGIALKKGKYKIKINDCLEYTATHNIKGQRITSKKSAILEDKIFIFGCSFAYGVGVNDEETFPFLLQNLEKKYQVQNFATPGSATIQAYLQLKKKLELGELPKIVVLCYATFHEERNKLTRGFESKLFEGIQSYNKSEFSDFKYPKCIIKSNDIEVKYISITKNFYSIPLVDNLAIATFVDQTWNKLDHKKTDKFDVSELLFIKIKKLAQKYNFRFVIADVSYNEQSKNIEKICLSNNLQYVNISPKYSDNNYSLAPCDFHPNQKAHLIYAKKLHQFLNKNK
jgi:hypothetical protein